MGSKRAAVLEAPDEDSTYGVGTPRRRASRAESRTMRKASYTVPEDDAIDDYADEYEEPAFQRQRGGFKLKVRKGIPKSWVGRGLFALGLLAVAGVIFAGLAGLRSALLHDSRFVMTTSADVEITGNHNVTRADVLSVFGADLERNIFRVPLNERRADLERLPWVAHATVMRLLPNRIRIAVTERTPVAFVRHGSQIGLVDASGVLLDMPADAAGDPHYSFPVLTGLSGNDPLSTRAARMAIYQRFLAELDSAGQKNSSSVSEVDVSNPEDVKALVASGGSDILVHFGDEQFLHRYQEFEQHLPDWKQQYPKLAAADMRYERQVVLEMQPGTGVPVSGDAASAAPAANTSSTTPSAPKAAAPPEPKAAAPKPPTHTTSVAERTKSATSAGKAKGGNGKIFADLAAARRAQQARARHAAAPGTGGR
ncbi:MAG TPA: FtsQ-type POTRA domain-containing protein [Acidobacteriaceae bacterium]